MRNDRIRHSNTRRLDVHIEAREVLQKILKKRALEVVRYVAKNKVALLFSLQPTRTKGEYV
jgi:hypothetical protein